VPTYRLTFDHIKNKRRRRRIRREKPRKEIFYFFGVLELQRRNLNDVERRNTFFSGNQQ
jgi:hypothetical protein